MTIIIFIIVLGLLVFVHEFGHFIVARRHGVKAEEFGFGFPPRIAGIWRDENKKFHIVWGNKEAKSNTENSSADTQITSIPGTLYSINWLPFGGFVKIKGESGEHESDSDSFSSKPFWRRSTILLAGVAMNILLTVVLLSVGFMLGIPQALDGVDSYAKIKDKKIELVEVLKNGPADMVGLMAGDTILKANNFYPTNAENLRQYLQSQEGNLIAITIKRNGGEQVIQVAAKNLPEIGKVGLGVFLLDTGLVSYPWHVSIWKGILVTGFLAKEILFAFGGLIKNLILTGKVAVDLAGPVGIAVLTGKVARLGFAYLLQFTAILSVNLAILNALPIPALDGGRFLFLVIEKIRRKPVSRKVENIIHNVGFILLITLVLLVTYRDLLRYSDPILRALRVK